MKPKVIVFDWDGTLVDMYGQCYEAFRRTYEAMGIPEQMFDHEKGHRIIGRPDNTNFPELFGDRADEARALYIQAHKDLAKAYEGLPPPLIDGAEEFVGRLRALKEKHGIHTVIATNKPGQLVRDELKLLGWDDAFDRVVGADDVASGNCKPHRDAMLEVLKTAPRGTRMKNILHIGDTETDMRFARNCDCKLAIVGDKGMDGLDEQSERMADLAALGDRLERLYRGPAWEHQA